MRKPAFTVSAWVKVISKAMEKWSKHATGQKRK
jgi:hypothetical protein